MNKILRIDAVEIDQPNIIRLSTAVAKMYHDKNGISIDLDLYRPIALTYSEGYNLTHWMPTISRTVTVYLRYQTNSVLFAFGPSAAHTLTMSIDKLIATLLQFTGVQSVNPVQPEES